MAETGEVKSAEVVQIVITEEDAPPEETQTDQGAEVENTRTLETQTDPVPPEETTAGPTEGETSGGQEDLSEVDKLTEEMGNCVASCSSGSSDELPSKYSWEQNVMEENVLKSGKFFRAAIVSFSDGELRAAGPKEFRPSKKAVKDIIKALEGDTSGIAEDMIDLGGGCNVSTPGKVDAGKAIYGADGKGGGCAIFKTKECVLITVYKSDPAPATRLAAEVAEYMEEDNNK